VGKIAKKAVICASVFLTTWHCILRAELTKMRSSECFMANLCYLGVSNTFLFLGQVYPVPYSKKYTPTDCFFGNFSTGLQVTHMHHNCLA